MKLYKFKSFHNIEHITEILCDQNFYAGSFYEMNDPMEGIFTRSETIDLDYLDQIREGKLKKRFCSFSATFNETLLWAHYSDSFRGICFEVDIDENDPNLCKVKYSPFDYYLADSRGDVDVVSREILESKFECWEYENEFRYFSNESKINFKLTSILFGTRTPEQLKKLVYRLKPQGVEVFETEISLNGIDKYKARLY